MSPLSLTLIYEPIQEEMLQLEENLEQVAKVDFLDMVKLLHYVLSDGGKRIRPALTLLTGKSHHYDLKQLLPMATAVELLHTATLVHDDTIDNSYSRRGRPTLNSLYGDSAAILLGDYLFAASAHLVSRINSPRMRRLFAHTFMSICSGEIDENFSLFDLRQTREQYYQRIGKKTASLFSMAAESGAILSKAPDEVVQALKNYGYNLGMSFQIVDDILDFNGGGEETDKPIIGNDLFRGVLTLPAILFLERYPGDDSIKGIFDSRDDPRKLELVVERIHNSSIIAECHNLAAAFCSKACSVLGDLPQNRVRQALFDLANYVIERGK